MVLIYICMDVLLAPECAVCLCVSVCYQIRVLTKNHIMCQTSVNLIPYLKKNTEQGPFVAKIPRLHMCASIISLGKIKHQLRHDHPFSQRNKATERALGLDVGGKGGGQKDKI